MKIGWLYRSDRESGWEFSETEPARYMYEEVVQIVYAEVKEGPPQCES